MNANNDLVYGLTPKQLSLISAVFNKHSHIDKAFIFGSRADGTFTKVSDIDFALLGDELTSTEIMRIKRELEELPIIYTFDVVHLDTLQKNHAANSNTFLEQILKTAKEFFVRA